MTQPIVLGSIAAALFVLAIVVVVFWWRSGYTFVQFVLDRIVFIILKLVWRAKTPAKLPLSRKRGAVIVANHRSSVDPFFIHGAAKRRVRWLVAREYCERKVLGWFLEEFGAIPTRRGGIDNASVRLAARYLEEGQWVGVLPEGKINTTDDFMLPVRAGAALLARRAGVPILPVYIEGAPYDGTPVGPFLMRANVKITVGQPIDPQGFESDEAMILAATKEIARLAGQDDFEPQMAGRSRRASAEPVSETTDSAEQ